MSGGCPQGTLIGVILYILYINPIGYPGEITIQISDILHQYWNNIGIVPDLLPNIITLPSTMNSAKYMDDATLQESIDLTTSLATKIDRSGPLPWWEDGGKVLPNQNTLLQQDIYTIKRISDDREMVLNSDKTKYMVINFCKSAQFQTRLYLNNTLLEQVHET